MLQELQMGKTLQEMPARVMAAVEYSDEAFSAATLKASGKQPGPSGNFTSGVHRSSYHAKFDKSSDNFRREVVTDLAASVAASK